MAPRTDYSTELGKYDPGLVEAAQKIVSESMNAYRKKADLYAASVKDMITNVTLPRIGLERDMIAYEILSNRILVDPSKDAGKSMEYALRMIEELL